MFVHKENADLFVHKENADLFVHKENADLFVHKENADLLIMRPVLFFALSERVLVVLRDGRTLIGYLRSLDQFGE